MMKGKEIEVRCPSCSGRGYLVSKKEEDCLTCKGKGIITVYVFNEGKV